MELFDSHCHLDIEPLKNDYTGAIERAHKANVVGMINVGSSLRGSKSSVELANSYPNIWASVGLHPHEADTTLDLSLALEEISELAKNDKVVAIGEVGLDYFDHETGGEVALDIKAKQKDLLILQIEIAHSHKLPIIFHVRDAWDDFFEILEKQKIECGCYPQGVVHCFTGSPSIAKKISSMGMYVGFTGFVTFEQDKFEDIRQAAKATPLEKIIIETDAPFLAPEPYRGKTNEPAFVVEVAKKIAELKNLSLEEVADITYKNTKKVFNIS